MLNCYDGKEDIGLRYGERRVNCNKRIRKLGALLDVTRWAEIWSARLPLPLLSAGFGCQQGRVRQVGKKH